jgi:hypothetical protein
MAKTTVVGVQQMREYVKLKKTLDEYRELKALLAVVRTPEYASDPRMATGESIKLPNKPLIRLPAKPRRVHSW